MSNSVVRLTLTRAKELLAKKAPADELNYRLNRVCERFLLNGKFMGSMSRLKLAAPFGQVALPRAYRTIEGVKVNGRVYDIANRWWDFLPGKANAYGAILETIDDMGDGHAVMNIPTRLPTAPAISPTVSVPDFPPGQGTIKATYADANFGILLEGKDANEMPVTLTLADQNPVTNPFARISRVKKKETQGTVKIEYTAPNDTMYGGVTILLALMEPTEEETYYRKYFLPTLSQSDTVAIEAFCKRRHIEFTRDGDILPFSNITALGLGLDAYELEANGYKTGANGFWNDGVAVLNAELGDANAENQIPAIRFYYPGRTKPKLSTHM